MKFSLVLAFAAVASVFAEEGTIRKRELAGASVSFPTCFSEASSVQVFGKGAVGMKDLKVGDRIFTGETYKPVYAFAHYDETAEAEFLQVHTEQGNVFEATKAHLVFVDGKGPVRVDTIQVGDALQGSAVAKIDTVQRTGLFAPLTEDGKLIVDGVMASNYVSLEQADDHPLFGYSVHSFSHFCISPFRLMCTTGSSKVCDSYSENGIPEVLASLHGALEWVVALPAVLQALVIVTYLVFAAMTWTMEVLAPTTPYVLAVVAGALFAAKSAGIRIKGSTVKTA